MIMKSGRSNSTRTAWFVCLGGWVCGGLVWDGAVGRVVSCYG